MAVHDRDYLWLAAGYGFIAGSRSLLAPALLAQQLSRHGPGAGVDRVAQLLVSGARLLKGLAAGELVVDKLPRTPPRTRLAPLSGRAMSAAVGGAAIGSRLGGRSTIAAAVGAAAAVGSAYALEKVRSRLERRLGVADPVAGVVEDALILAVGRALMRRLP